MRLTQKERDTWEEYAQKFDEYEIDVTSPFFNFLEQPSDTPRRVLFFEKMREAIAVGRALVLPIFTEGVFDEEQEEVPQPKPGDDFSFLP